MSQNVTIGRMKRDLSTFVNQVAFGGESFVLTSRGKPKAALVSLKDFERLRKAGVETGAERARRWLERSDALAAEILRRRGGAPIDVDELLRQNRDDLETRLG